jgi:hypothetical protein
MAEVVNSLLWRQVVSDTAEVLQWRAIPAEGLATITPKLATLAIVL